MKTYLITFDFAEEISYGGTLTISESLEEHSRVKDFLSNNAAVQLAPNSFLLRTEIDMAKVYSELITYIDKHESLFIFDVEINRYQTFSQPEIREALGEAIKLGVG